MNHVPMCKWCGEHEVGSISGGSADYCSTECIDAVDDEIAMDEQAACLRAEIKSGFYEY